MINYKLYQDNRSNSLYPGKWYARAVATETIDLDALASHMANHNTPYSAGAIKGVLTDMVNCIKELVLDGKNVKIPDLAIFSAGISCSPADTAAKFNASTNVRRVYLRSRATGILRSSVLENEASVRELENYTVTKEPITDTGTGE